jgi:hypothetical protein
MPESKKRFQAVATASAEAGYQWQKQAFFMQISLSNRMPAANLFGNGSLTANPPCV